MENSVQVLKQTELCGQQFKVYGTPEEPFFFAQDVANVLELTNVSDMIQRVEEDERSKFNLGRQGEAWFLTEEGLYEVLMQSRKPVAKQFKKGVKTILKEIRRTGGYIADQEEDSPEDIMARALIVAQETMKRKEDQILSLTAEKERLQLTTEEQEHQLIAQAPKVEYCNKVLDSKGLQTTNMIAACFGISAKHLNILLCSWGIQYKQSDTYFLFSKYRDRGLTEHRPYVYVDSTGMTRTKQNMYWTEKGKQFIIEQYTAHAREVRCAKALNEQHQEAVQTIRQEATL